MFFEQLKRFCNNVLSYFVKGVFSLLPFFVSFYLLSYCFNFALSFTGVGNARFYLLFVILLFVIICGYLTDNFVLNKFYNFSESFIDKIPIVSSFYYSVKEIFRKLLSNKIKFDKPVLVYINVLESKKKDIKKIGFITNEALDFIGLEDDVAVLIPQAFSLAADVWIVPKKNIEHISQDLLKGADLYNFIITGGFVDINNNIVKK